jgi:hypothetical protein
MSNEFLRRNIEWEFEFTTELAPGVIEQLMHPTPSNYVPPKEVVHIWMKDAEKGSLPLCGDANAPIHLCPAFSEKIVVLPYLAQHCYCRMPVCSFCLLLWEGLPR